MRWLAIIFAVLQLGAAAPPARLQYEPVSLVAILADPAAYDGKALQVSGHLVLEFEGDAIYLSKDDADHVIATNGVWIDRPAWVDRHVARTLTGRPTMVEAVFSATERGHMGLFPGSLKDVRRIERLPSRAEFGVQFYPSITAQFLIGLAASVAIAALVGWLSLGRKPRAR